MLCSRCGKSGSHFVPRSLNEPAFFTCQPGAGGGQAVTPRLVSTEIEPVVPGPIECGDAKKSAGAPGTDPAPTLAADLNRWYCGPYCPKCGFQDDRGNTSSSCYKRCLPRKPGLHTRCPETRVEGLECCNGNWWLEHQDPALLERVRISPAHATDLLVMGTEKALLATQFNFTIWQDDGGFEYDIEPDGRGPNIRVKAATRAEAVAIAGHRAADAEETNG